MFTLDFPYQPNGDQPTAINQLVECVNQHTKHQTLLGVTGWDKYRTGGAEFQAGFFKLFS